MPVLNQGDPGTGVGGPPPGPGDSVGGLEAGGGGDSDNSDLQYTLK